MSEARKIGKIAREAQKLNAMVFKETNIGSSELELIHYVWLLEDFNQEEKETFLITLDKMYAKSKKESRSHFPNVMQRIQTL